MRSKIAAFIVAASFLLVGGCGDSQSNMHCVSSHTAIHTTPIYGYRTVRSYSTIAKRWVTTTTRYVAGYSHSVYNVCDHWVHN